MTSDKVSYKLLADQFVKRYMKDKDSALIWAMVHIDKDVMPKLKPLVREELKRHGYTFTSETGV